MKHHTDIDTTVQELKNLVVEFREERGWGVHHDPRSLAISIAIEAAELMEHFQWGEYSSAKKQEVSDELADVLIYCFNLADTLGVDVSQAYRDKLARAKAKYPVEIFHPGSDDPKEYARIKKNYREGKQQ